MDRVKTLLTRKRFRFTDEAPSSQPTSAASNWGLPPPRPAFSARPPRILIIGAGSRGTSFARSIMGSSNGVVAAVAEPAESKRKRFGRHFIWGVEEPQEGMEFVGWAEFIEWELNRRQKKKRGEEVPEGIDGVVVCTIDSMHAEIVISIVPLNLHILCEKPLATTLDDCLRIYASLLSASPTALFGICHVLRYSPHNVLLRKLLLEDEAVGAIISLEHTEPIGWWHFSHSYVRGNWRSSSTSAPSLLTKSCHDIDLLLWLLCSPRPNSENPPHLPSKLSSTGALVHFKRSRKPESAGAATNCLSCPIENDCQFSAKKLYYEKSLLRGNMGWPLNVVVPDIEDHLRLGLDSAKEKVLSHLAEDYNADTDPKHIKSRCWYGRCVWDADNDVCDDQFVTVTWEDDFLDNPSVKQESQKGRQAKTAVFHMIAFTEELSVRRTRVYGSKGEIVTDGRIIKVYDFASGRSEEHLPHLSGGAHGGGDDGLARQFCLAIDAVKNHGMSVADAQRIHIGCALEEVIMSHAFVFAAEEARVDKKVLDWKDWWVRNVEEKMGHDQVDATCEHSGVVFPNTL